MPQQKSLTPSAQSAGLKITNTIDRYIDCEDDLATYGEDMKKRSINAIALDMEGDQGNMRYAYSISILQVFDGQEKVIIDVLKMGNNPTLRDFLMNAEVIKIMFSCANDVFMAQNVLGCTISPVKDIAVGQKLLGLPINLSDHLAIDKKLKDKFQRANWLKRPLSRELLDYAINDVTELFSLEQNIVKQLEAKGLLNEYWKNSVLLTEKNYVIDHLQHYKAKFPGFNRLGLPMRREAAIVWVFRELMGKHFDCPVGYILSKQALVACIGNPEHTAQALEQELNRGRSIEKKVKTGLVEKFYREAIRITGK